MQILHVINGLDRKGLGVSQIVWGQAVAQQALGCDVSVYSLVGANDAEDWPAHRDPKMVVRTFLPTGPRGLSWSRSLAKALLDAGQSGEHDLLHQHGLWSMLSHGVHRWQKVWRRPTIVAAHGMLDRVRLRKSRFKKKLFAFLIESKNLHAATCLHATSPGEIQAFRDYGLSQPIALVPNGIHLESFAEPLNPLAFQKRLPEVSGRPYILYLGRVTPLKGISHLLDAWKRLERLRKQGWLLVIAGPAQMGHDKELQTKTASLALTKDVLFTGPLYDEAKWDALAGASAFVLPSFSEGFSIATLEAMAFHLPIIITRCCYFDEVVAHRAGWVGEPSADSMTELLDQCLSLSRAERKAYGQRGYDLVRKQYTWKRIAQRMKAVYKWMLGGGTPPADIVV